MKSDKTPEIRFQGFTEAWEQREVGQYYFFKNGLNKGKEFFGHGTPIVNFTDVFRNRGLYENDLNGRVQITNDEYQNYAVKKGDVFFTRTSETIDEIGYPSVALESMNSTVFSGFVLRGRAIEIDPLENHFKKYVFFTEIFRKEMIKKSSMTTRALTSGTAIKKMEVQFPSQKSEQEKIGALLTKIDMLITCHQRKYDKLVNVKRSMLEKMFPKNGQDTPEIRFQGFTEAWEQREFDDLLNTNISTNSLSRDMLTDEPTNIKNIHYGDILVKYREIASAKFDKIPHIIDDDKNKYNGSFLQNGDVIFADAAEDETAGKASEISDISDELIVSGLHTIVARPTEKVAGKYLGYYINSNAYHNQLLPLMQGTKVLSISKSILSKTSLNIAKGVEEQTSIGTFFKTLDNLITCHQRELEKLKNVKKSLLEKMFV